MGLNQEHALGREAQISIQPQLGAESYPAFTQIDSTSNTGAEAPQKLAVLSSSMSFDQERKNRSDTSPSRDYFERITGNKTVTWTVGSHLLIPSQGGSGTSPDWHNLMASCMGVATGAAGKITYSVNHGQSATAMTMTREVGAEFAETVWGAITEECTISIAQGDDPSIEFTGTASDYAATARTTVSDGSIAPGDSDIVVADAKAFSVNSVIKIGSDDATNNTGYRITAIDTATNTLTISPALVGGTPVTNGDTIIPWVDSNLSTQTNTLVNGIQGQCDLGSISDLEINAFSLTVKNNFKEVREAFKPAVQDQIPGRRDITGEITVSGRRDRLLLIPKRMTFDTGSNIVARFGGNSTGDEKLTITIAKPEFDFSEVSVPEAEEVTMTLPFTALASSDTATDIVTIEIATV